MSSNSEIHAQPLYHQPFLGLAGIAVEAVGGAESSAGGPGKLLSREETVLRSPVEFGGYIGVSDNIQVMNRELALALVIDAACA